MTKACAGSGGPSYTDIFWELLAERLWHLGIRGNDDVIAAWDKLARPVGGKVFGQDALLTETRSDDGPARNFATTLG